MLIACVTVLLVSTSTVIADGSTILEYPLRIIDYLIERHVGPFECVFIDTSSPNPYVNVLGDLLQSSMLKDVVRYVTQGFYRNDLLPKHPSLLMIHPGRETDLRLEGKIKAFMHMLNQFSPTSKVLVFLDCSEAFVIYVVRFILTNLNFNNVFIFDTYESILIVNSLVRYETVRGVVPHPAYFFKWFKDQLSGRNISYVREPRSGDQNPKHKWLVATADYLNVEVYEFIEKQDGPKAADVQLEANIAYGVPAHFQSFFVSTPQVGRILVPRGRPLHAVEIMVMPFDWQVWAFLLTLLALTEVVKHFLPEVFKNEPILLVVFGFGRFNLHRAGYCEKIILQSLIVLMFFMTNAFETKIVSLMVEKPSTEPVKCLEDFDKYGLKFRYNIDKYPEVVNHPVIGNYVTNGEHIEVWENVPGIAKYVTQAMADLVPRFSYDFERGQSWFVVLDESFFVDAILVHLTAFRSPYLETFHFTEQALEEAGIMPLWWRQSGDLYWMVAWGLRPRGNILEENYLVFEDMMLAWITLAIGCSISIVGFIGEHASKRIFG